MLVAGDEELARGGKRRQGESARVALATWQGDRTCIADPRCVVQARTLARIAAELGINVVHRGHDDAWRYVIVRLFDDGTIRREQWHRT